MKQFSNLCKSIGLGVVSILSTTITFAQDDLGLEFEISINKEPFYTQLWFWITIGLVFLILLIALLRGGGGKNKVKKIDKD